MEIEESKAELLIWLKHDDKELYYLLLKEAERTGKPIFEIIKEALREYILEQRKLRGDHLVDEMVKPIITAFIEQFKTRIAGTTGLSREELESIEIEEE